MKAVDCQVTSEEFGKSDDRVCGSDSIYRGHEGMTEGVAAAGEFELRHKVHPTRR